MPAERDAAFRRLDESLFGVDPEASSTTKYSRLETSIAALASLQAHEVAAVTVSKANNLRVRSRQSPRSSTAKLLVWLLTKADDIKKANRAAARCVQAGEAVAGVLLVQDTTSELRAPWGFDSRTGNTPLTKVARVLGTGVVRVAAQTTVGSDTGAPTAPLSVSAVPLLELDPRVRRMLRTAVASRPAVMLVGPPGTGKSQLINELLLDISSDPSLVGMSTPPKALTVTPDESWTTRELVGGETVDDHGRIRYSLGVVLQAIMQDRWLVLDEANRADLDRIFGGLLTWLAGSHVDVGRVSNAPDAGPIQLGWANELSSITNGTDALTNEDEGGDEDAVEFLAGREWRLLGTYNALDAQRVFRFGLALGRRFAHVPVLPPGIEGFAKAVESRLSDVSENRRDQTRSRIIAIYQAHLDAEDTALGPAIFLDMPSYVAAAPEDASLEEVLAEAYLTAVGSWLARLEDDQLDVLGAALGADGCLGEQAAWVRAQLPALR